MDCLTRFETPSTQATPPEGTVISELLVAIPEYQTALDGGNAGSQSDVFCLVRAALGVIALTVEAKVDESFGPTIAGWKTKTSERGGAARWSQMCSKLGVGTDWPELVRYQLLHRLAAAVIEQERFGTKVAAMVVQSFCADDRLNGFKDFCNFAGHMGVVEVQKNRMYRTRAEGCPKLIGWVQEPTDNLGVARSNSGVGVGRLAEAAIVSSERPLRYPVNALLSGLTYPSAE